MNVSSVDNSRAPEVLPGRNFLLLVHYWLPVALGWSLALVMQRATGAAISPVGMTLLLTGIGAAYSFDRLIDGPPESSPHPRWLRGALCAAVIACAAAMLFLLAACKIEANTLKVAAILSAASLLYSRLKRLPLMKTFAVALAWTWASAAMPLAGVEGLAWTWLSLDVSLPLILLLSAGCLLCDLKDAHQDEQQRVPSLPVLIGTRATCAIAAGLSLIATGMAVMHHRPAIITAGALLALAAQFPALLAKEAIGPIVIDLILVVPGVLICTGAV